MEGIGGGGRSRSSWGPRSGHTYVFPRRKKRPGADCDNQEAEGRGAAAPEPGGKASAMPGGGGEGARRSASPRRWALEGGGETGYDHELGTTWVVPFWGAGRSRVVGISPQRVMAGPRTVASQGHPHTGTQRT